MRQPIESIKKVLIHYHLTLNAIATSVNLKSENLIIECMNFLLQNLILIFKLKFKYKPDVHVLTEDIRKELIDFTPILKNQVLLSNIRLATLEERSRLKDAFLHLIHIQNEIKENEILFLQRLSILENNVFHHLTEKCCISIAKKALEHLEVSKNNPLYLKPIIYFDVPHKLDESYIKTIPKASSVLKGLLTITIPNIYSVAAELINNEITLNLAKLNISSIQQSTSNTCNRPFNVKRLNFDNYFYNVYSISDSKGYKFILIVPKLNLVFIDDIQIY
jgi:hypothetical protein